MNSKNYLINNERNRQIVTRISLLLFIASLISPAILYQGDPEATRGISILGIGWAGLFMGIVSWYANIIYIFVLITFKKNKLDACAILSAIMIAMMGTMLFLYFPGTPRDEAGAREFVIKHLEIGAYLWFTSLLLPLIFCLVYSHDRNSTK